MVWKPHLDNATVIDLKPPLKSGGFSLLIQKTRAAFERW